MTRNPRKLLALPIAAFLSLAAGSAALAAPPTDAEVDAFVATVSDATKDITDPRDKAKTTVDTIKANLDKISWNEITVPQLEKLAAKLYMSPCPELRAALHPRLLELSKLDTVDGARAADLALGAWPNLKDTSEAGRKADQAAKTEVLLRGLSNPKAADNFKNGKGHGILRTAGSLSPALMTEHKVLEKVEPFINSDLSLSAAANLGGILNYVTDEDSKLDKAEAARVRTKIAAAAKAASTKDDPRYADDPKTAARVRKSLKDMEDLCNSAFARGELLNHPAPNIKFVWSNSASPLNSFADLKGKVVVVDFWATWCSPCVGSFPKVRQLVERYKDYPVAVVGVTSDQGYHIARIGDDKKKTEKIDCDGDPKKEHDLMTQYIKDMDITWTIAFSDKSVFNPDFGVRGIPHVAIIDPEGKVRHNGLHPASIAKDAELIDKLLEEFKLPKPSEPLANKDE